MKNLFSILFIFLMIGGCAPSYTVSISQEKEVLVPFSRFLIVYMEGACEINFLDPTTYEICLKEVFTDTNNFQVHVESENFFSKKMLSAHIDIKKFTEFFDAGNNTYPRFQYVLDSLKVEAVLLINRTGYQHVPVTRPGDFNTPANIYQSGSKTGWVDAAYKCYLIKPHSFFPIWSAKFDFIKGSKASIRKAMAKQLLKSLHDGQYIF